MVGSGECERTNYYLNFVTLQGAMTPKRCETWTSAWTFLSQVTLRPSVLVSWVEGPDHESDGSSQRVPPARESVSDSENIKVPSHPAHRYGRVLPHGHPFVDFPVRRPLSHPPGVLESG